MKKVIIGKELQDKMEEGVKLLCGTVKNTLGPKGLNAIIDHSAFSPFITNDGVTIAENIESEDPVINTILELTKEASIKTNDTVGDGTTSTLVLLESIFEEGLELVKKGYSPILLKKEIDEVTTIIIEKIKEEGIKPTEKDLIDIASIAGSDEKIGKILVESANKVGINNIKVSEHDLEETKINYLKGYLIDTLIASPYFFKGEEQININNPKIFITTKEILEIEQISIIINYAIKSHDYIILIAKDYSDNFINEIVSMYYENEIKIILLKSPSYGEEEINILNDIAIISNTNIVYNLEDININKIGYIKSIIIDKEKTKFYFENNMEIKGRIEELEKKAKTEKAKYGTRLAMLKNGSIEILVGAPTTTERREKKMRFDDALCAIKCAKKGIVPGSGIILYKISKELNEKDKGTNIIKNALTKPIKQIIANAGLNSTEILKNIEDNNFNILYNIKEDKYEDINNTKVKDTIDVIINSLKNAVSIASMLLTTNSLIINEYKNNLNKVNDYNEL